MSSNCTSRAIADFIVTHFLTFGTADVCHSFIVGNRNNFDERTARDYRKNVFNLVLNLFTKDIAKKELQTEACKFFKEFLGDYGKLLIELKARGGADITAAQTALAKRKVQVSCDYASIRGFWEFLSSYASHDETARYFDYAELNFDNDIYSLFPAEGIPDTLSKLSDVYNDYTEVTRHNDVLRKQRNLGNDNLMAIATSNQLMSGVKEFMSHLGVATSFHLLSDGGRKRIRECMRQEPVFSEECINDPKLFEDLIARNLKSAEKHLELLVLDFMKALILVHMENYRVRFNRNLPWDFMQQTIDTRCRENIGLGQGAAYRFNYYGSLLKHVAKLAKE